MVLTQKFNIKLTPKHVEPVYAQSLPTPTILKDEMLVELALQQEYGIITTLYPLASTLRLFLHNENQTVR